ncbi:MAG TPA: type IV secretion protein Rhs [Pasteurellaceae bacterium]|nr:type IV secretion protein Rhs [Pasteurellaceae bacterium]
MNLSTYSESVFDWFETPLVKLIVSKESKGSYNAYNITGWNAKGKNTVYESHFEPTAQYHLEKMTITEIKTAQKTYIGPNKKHMLAVGIFQMIPATLNDFLRWLNKYKSINENSQLFDRKFQDLTPLYFWDKKRSNISAYFKGNKTVEHAAYAIAQEWASAAVPKDMRTVSGLVSNGNMSYYAGDGLNKAHYSADKTIKALEETKRIIDDAGGYEVVKELTLSTLKN